MLLDVYPLRGLKLQCGENGVFQALCAKNISQISRGTAMQLWLLLNINRKARDRFAVDFFIHRRHVGLDLLPHSRLSNRANQWRNDGVAVASRDGGPHW